MATTVITGWKDSWELQPGRTEKWSYDQGVVLKGLESLWLNTGDGKYFRFIQQSIDRFVKDDGTIRTYKIDEVTALAVDLTGLETSRIQAPIWQYYCFICLGF